MEKLALFRNLDSVNLGRDQKFAFVISAPVESDKSDLRSHFFSEGVNGYQYFLKFQV